MSRIFSLLKAFGMSNSNPAELQPKKTSFKFIVWVEGKMGRLNNKLQSISYGLA